MESSTNGSDEIKRLLIEDYERVIFYLLGKLDTDIYVNARNLDEINVVMKEGFETYEFKVKKPHEQTGVIVPHVHTIEYLSQI